MLSHLQLGYIAVRVPSYLVMILEQRDMTQIMVWDWTLMVFGNLDNTT